MKRQTIWFFFSFYFYFYFIFLRSATYSNVFCGHSVSDTGNHAVSLASSAVCKRHTPRNHGAMCSRNNFHEKWNIEIDHSIRNLLHEKRSDNLLWRYFLDAFEQQLMSCVLCSLEKHIIIMWRSSCALRELSTNWRYLPTLSPQS